jgi:dTDP-4-dehydrorhamnose reductase
VRLLVVGNGLLGQSIRDAWFAGLDRFTVSKETRSYVHQIHVLAHDLIDITSQSSIEQALAKFVPDVVVNSAALHTIDACENDPARARELNAVAAGRLASMVPTVYISTDYVFNDNGPHTEELPGSTPRSAYGRSKLAGELATLEHGGVVVRVSGMYGHFVSRAKGNKGFPDALLQSSDPIRLPTDQRFSPTYASHAAERILQISQMLADGKANGIYHAANRGAISWAEWAESILAATGHKRHVLPAVFNDPIRPTDSSLKSTRLPALPHFMQGLSAWASREGRVEFVSPLRDA